MQVKHLRCVHKLVCFATIYGVYKKHILLALLFICICVAGVYYFFKIKNHSNEPPSTPITYDNSFKTQYDFNYFSATFDSNYEITDYTYDFEDSSETLKIAYTNQYKIITAKIKIVVTPTTIYHNTADSKAKVVFGSELVEGGDQYFEHGVENIGFAEIAIRITSFDSSFRDSISVKEVLENINVYNVSRPNNLYNDSHIQEKAQNTILHTFNELTFELPAGFTLKSYSYVKPGFKEMNIINASGDRALQFIVFFDTFRTPLLYDDYIWKVYTDGTVTKYYGYETVNDTLPSLVYFSNQTMYVKVYPYSDIIALPTILDSVRLN